MLIKLFIMGVVLGAVAQAQCIYTQVADSTLTVIGNSAPQPMPTGSTITNTLAYTLTASGKYITQSIAQIQVVNGKVSVCLPGPTTYQMQYQVLNPYPLSGATQYNRVWTIPATTSSVVNTTSSGNTVSWVSGTTFISIQPGNTVVIAGTPCTTSAPCTVATVPSSVSLTLTSSPGIHSGEALTSNGPYLVSQVESLNGSPAAAATWTQGSGSPTGTCVNGSLYSNTSGTAGSTFYDCVGTTWVAFTSPN